MPPLDIEIALDLEVDFGVCNGGTSDGVYHRLIVYADHDN